ncbi:MAG TPA: quinone oxidoreductase [Burkholderiaceae bacterium]|jgi:NADPH2:quinone reductase
MSRAIVIAHAGGPEVLELKRVSVEAPGPGELLVRHTAIGVNFHDVYVRSGQYPNILPMPGIPGVEACGVVEAIGSGVAGFEPGDRIAYMSSRYGAYSEIRNLDARLAVHVPPEISDKAAATLMVKGTTAALLLFEVAPVERGDTILVHAAAGGMGRLLSQWASRIGATVIGTVGGDHKKSIALDSGCHDVIDYSSEDFVRRVRELTSGRGVRVVYDSVGQATFSGSIECLAKRGHLVSFGQSSGPAEPITMAQLSAKSLTVSRPIVFHYVEDYAAFEALIKKVFAALSAGIITAGILSEYSLADARLAHRDLERRIAMGSPVLIP